MGELEDDSLARAGRGESAISGSAGEAAQSQRAGVSVPAPICPENRVVLPLAHSYFDFLNNGVGLRSAVSRVTDGASNYNVVRPCRYRLSRCRGSLVIVGGIAALPNPRTDDNRLSSELLSKHCHACTRGDQTITAGCQGLLGAPGNIFVEG